MNAKEQETQSQIASYNLQGKKTKNKTRVIISHYIRIRATKCNKRGVMAMRAREKSARLAHRDGLPWRGSSLADVLFLHCASGAEGS